MIINIRGTSGSGKTTVVRGIIDKYQKMLTIRNGDHSPIQPLNDGESRGKILGYRLEGSGPRILVVGSYENVCGGADTIKTQDEICARIMAYAPHGHVLVEGLLMSTIFTRYRDLARSMKAMGHQYIWAFLQTPVEECINRIKQRRAEREARGETLKPIDWEKTRAKFKVIERIQRKATAAGLDVRPINGAEDVWAWLHA